MKVTFAIYDLRDNALLYSAFDELTAAQMADHRWVHEYGKRVHLLPHVDTGIFKHITIAVGLDHIPRPELIENANEIMGKPRHVMEGTW